jgi:hypothetical protein
LDASLTNAGSGAWSSTITRHAAARTILSINPSACSELSPNPTSATSGRSRTVTGAYVFDVDLAGDHFVSERPVICTFASRFARER